MGDATGMPRRKPVPVSSQQPPLPENWAGELTSQFRRMLSTRRMNELSRRSQSLSRSSSQIPTDFVLDRSHPSTPSQHGHDAPLLSPAAPQPPMATLPAHPPPAYSSLKNIPTLPTPPTDNKSVKFRSMLTSLSNTPCKWENPGLLDEALRAVPLERIYGEAQEESDLFAAEAASLGGNTKPAWGYQDCVVRALMRWFKRDFFMWVNNPRCSICRSPTISCAMAAPLPDESARAANRVELYKCSHPQCQSYERFPRYNDAFVLLQTRRGRVGEWANCFSMLCRAVGSRVRWVWNAEDHVWTEVYSDHRKRWVHVDACEEAWDAPLLYSQGWGKKMSYCIAFSAEGCTDVTRRYVRSPTDHALPRARVSEAALMHILAEIKTLRRKDMDKKQKFQLNAEDMREDAELRKNVIEALAYNISLIAPGGDAAGKGKGASSRRNDADAQKAAESRAAVRVRGSAEQNQPAQQRDPRGQ